MALHVTKTMTLAASLTTALLFTGFSNHALAMSPFKSVINFPIMGKIWVQEHEP
jgi:hypothetical protein